MAEKKIANGVYYFRDLSTCHKITETYGVDKYYSRVICHDRRGRKITEKVFLTSEGKHHSRRAEEFLKRRHEQIKK